MKTWLTILAIVLIIGIIGGAGYLGLRNGPAEAGSTPQAPVTVPVTRGDVQQTVTAPGQVVGTREVLLGLEVSGLLAEITVRPGDAVQAGAVLARLDTGPLEDALETARLELAEAEARHARDLAEAELDLQIATAELEQEKARLPGVAAAAAVLTAAQAELDELLAGPDENEITVAAAELRQAEVALKQAQWAYDQVAYGADIGGRPEAAQLEEATLNYEAKLAAYKLAVGEPTQADIANARAKVQQAHAEVNKALADQGVSGQQVAILEAQGEKARLALEALQAGVDPALIRAVTIAEEKLEAATLTAPFAGTILEVLAKPGQTLMDGAEIISMADASAVEIWTKVIEEDLPQSIRWRLPLSYAAIALLAALSLGAVLLTSLRGYYMQRELDYLNSNAGAISLVMAHLLADNPSPEALETRLRGFSFLSQTRVRLLDESGEIIADSFSPQERHERVGLAFDVPAGTIWQRAIPGEEDHLPAQVEVEVEHRISPEAVQKIETVEKKNVIIVLDDAPEQNVLSRTVVITTSEVSAPSQIIAYRQTVKSGQPLPGPPDPLFLSVAGTPYGFDLSAEIADDRQRSDQSVRRPFYDPDGNLRYIELSEGPAYGRQILNSVAQGWAIASGVAVLLAAGAGWFISRRISTPLLALADVTMDIAGGNLSTRADVARQDELGLLARSFNEMADQVEETVVALRRFVADAAHELYTPLTALRTDLELVADAESEPERQRLVCRAQTQLDRLRTLTASLLELSRLEAGARQSQMVLFDLSSFIQEMSEPYASQAEQAGLTLSLQVPAETVSVQGDKAQLQMAISNLLDNALKFTPGGGKVIVRLQSYQPWAELQIEDSGIGIPPEDLPRLFSRFHRGRNAAAYPGSGLGLAIVKVIIEGHGGQVMAENTGQGARFSMQLPIENK